MTRRLPVDPGTIHLGHRPLDREVDHYARTVLRLHPGAALTLFDGAGTTGLATLTPTGVEVHDVQSNAPESPQITLYQAIPKGDRWDLVLEKATELGVNRIVPIETQWSVVQTPAAKADQKVERWQRIVTAAARQSERVFTPQIARPVPLKAAARDATESTHWLAHPGAGPPNRPHGPSLGIWIGPEAGFSEADLAILTFATPVSLGPHILRAETAGMFAVGLARHLAGST